MLNQNKRGVRKALALVKEGLVLLSKCQPMQASPHGHSRPSFVMVNLNLVAFYQHRCGRACVHGILLPLLPLNA
jgi:hypothetical protein